VVLRRRFVAVLGALAAVAGSAVAVLAVLAPASQAASSCAKSSLSLQHSGQLTVATDSPAYPPYFENNKPANGKGFESAVAYAIAHQLGFSPAQVKWTVEPFDDSYAPGPKSFDFDINEISITSARAKAVDFSTPYYTNPQAIVVGKGSKYAHVTSLAGLRGAKLGVQVGTTSLQAVNSVIHPTSQPQVFNTSNDVVTALREHLVDAIVVDLATGFDLVQTEIPHGSIAGQFNAPGGDNWGVLLAKHSKLTLCVDQAISQIRSNGTLKAITARWTQSGASVPVLR
jgi:polar amino acid transport system substrate-binding protein